MKALACSLRFFTEGGVTDHRVVSALFIKGFSIAVKYSGTGEAVRW